MTDTFTAKLRAPLISDAYSLLIDLELRISEVPTGELKQQRIEMSNAAVDLEFLAGGLALNYGQLPGFYLFEYADPIPDEASGLGKLLTTESELRSLLRDSQGFFRAMQEHHRAGHIKYCAAEPEGLHERLATLIVTLKSLTPAQFRMQLHLQTLFLARADSPDAEEKLSLVEPLVRLRDEYFASSKPETLERYLKIAASLVDNPLYTKWFVPAHAGDTDYASNHRTHLEKATLELELLSLLEYASSTTHNRTEESDDE